MTSGLCSRIKQGIRSRIVIAYLEGVHIFSRSSTLVVKLSYDGWKALQGVICPSVRCLGHYSFEEVHTPPSWVSRAVTTCRSNDFVNMQLWKYNRGNCKVATQTTTVTLTPGWLCMTEVNESSGECMSNNVALMTHGGGSRASGVIH